MTNIKKTLRLLRKEVNKKNKGGKTKPAARPVVGARPYPFMSDTARNLSWDGGSYTINEEQRRKEQERATAEAVAADQKRMKEWLKENEDLDPKPFTKIYRDNETRMKDEISRLAVQYLGSIQGIVASNEVLRYGLGMEEAGVDAAEADQFAVKLFRIAVFKTLLTNSNFDSNLQQLLLDRFCAREFPAPQSALNPGSGGRSAVKERGELLDAITRIIEQSQEKIVEELGKSRD